MTTNIISCGSKWAGQDPDDLETLLEVLARHPLESVFAPFLQTDPETGRTTFQGNFRTISHCFHIETDDAPVVASLAAAIIRNIARPDYIPRRVRETA